MVEIVEVETKESDPQGGVAELSSARMLCRWCHFVDAPRRRRPAGRKRRGMILLRPVSL